MSKYQDRYGMYHDKPTINWEPISNNAWIYTSYAKKAGLPYSEDLVNITFLKCKKPNISLPTGMYLIRTPYKACPPISRDEILGMAALGFLAPSHLDGWSFSPYPIPSFNLKTLIKQVKELKGQHRNYFWQNKLDQIYRFAFSVPVQDRAFLLECWGETKSLRYFFYKGIAMLDAKFAKPKNGIHWLKYGGEERKKIMQQEFPEDHPLRGK